MLVTLTEKNGTKYDIPNSFGEQYILPRCEFLLHMIKEIEKKLIDWYVQNKCSQGDSYYVSLTKSGRWIVSHTNDYPMQHGSGSHHVLTEDEFKEATSK